MDEPVFNRMAVIGLGLIGGSVAAGVRQQGLCRHITAWDQDPHSLKLGHDLGLIDEVATSVAAATAGADLVLVAVPVQAMQSVFEEIDPVGKILTDVGSVKGAVMQAAEQAFGTIPPALVPAHPIAGSEQHGVIAARPDLFNKHRVIVTPHEHSDETAIRQVTQLWQRLGAEVVTMEVAHHDEVLAQTSHLPHLLAYALVDVLASGSDSLEVFEYAAGGFRDFSRIAASDPTMWRDIFLANGAPVTQVLDDYIESLQALRTMLEQEDGEGLKQVFSRAKVARDHFTAIQADRLNDDS